MAVPDPATTEWVPVWNTTVIGGGGSGGGPHHATHEPLGTDEIVNINALHLTSGTVNDARLSANVALKNIDNGFVAQTFATNSFINGVQSALYFRDTSGAVDARVWRFIQAGGALFVDSLNDALTVVQGRVTFNRNGQIDGNGGGLTNLNASNLAAGTVPTARLGSGTADSTTFLRGDQTWAPMSGGGSSIPAGLMVLSITPCPAGWARVGADGYFIRLAPTGGAGGAIGGAAQHAHTGGSYAVAAHNHGGSVSISGNTGSAGAHSHTYSDSGTTNQSSQTHQAAAGSGASTTNFDHKHDFSVSGTTSSEPSHQHSFAGTGAIANASPSVNGTSALADTLPLYQDFFLCQKL